MVVEVWQDYACPWAYLGRHRSAVLRDLGFEVVTRPFELHPETPPVPVEVRPGGRLAAVLARIGAECAALDIAFAAPTRTPNTRLALKLVEVARAIDPTGVAALDDALFEARFVADADLSDRHVLAELLERVGLDVGLLERTEAGDGREALDASMAAAREAGIAATPAWRFATGFVVPGVHDPATMRRWALRIIERSGGAGRIDRDG